MSAATIKRPPQGPHSTSVNLAAFRTFLLALAVAAARAEARERWDYENMGGALMACRLGWGQEAHSRPARPRMA